MPITKLQNYLKSKLPSIIKRSTLYRHLCTADKNNKYIKLAPRYIKVNLNLRHNKDLEKLMDFLEHWIVDKLPYQIFVYMYIFVYTSVNQYRIKEDQEYFCYFFDKYKDFALVEQLRIFMRENNDEVFILEAIKSDQTDLVEYFNDIKVLSVNLSENIQTHYINAASHGRLYFIQYLNEEEKLAFDGYQEILESAQNGHLECLKYFIKYHTLYSYRFENACNQAYEKAKQFNQTDCANHLEQYLPKASYVDPFTNNNYQTQDNYEDLPYEDLPYEDLPYDNESYYQENSYYGDL